MRLLTCSLITGRTTGRTVHAFQRAPVDLIRGPHQVHGERTRRHGKHPEQEETKRVDRSSAERNRLAEKREFHGIEQRKEHGLRRPSHEKGRPQDLQPYQSSHGTPRYYLACRELSSTRFIAGDSVPLRRQPPVSSSSTTCQVPGSTGLSTDIYVSVPEGTSKTD